MARKKEHGWLNELYKLIIVIPSLCNITAYCLNLITDELKKLLDKFLCLIAIFVIIAIIGLTSWLCICGIIFYQLLSMPLGVVSALVIVLGINLLLFLIFIIAYKKIKRNIKVDIPFS